MARVRNDEFIVKSSEKDRKLVIEMMLKNTEKLFFKRIFLYAVVVLPPKKENPTQSVLEVWDLNLL